MKRSGSLTPTALGWIREDLDRTLGRARQQIESISANPGAGPAAYEGALESFRDLGDLFATLVADGPCQVCREMFALLEAMQGREVPDPEPAAAALMDGMVVLPAYLDRLQSGHQDLPLLLLPLINRLRDAWGREPMTEGTVFTPLLDVELPELELVRKPGYDEPFEFFTARLHRQYEKALQNWLQDQSQLDQLSAMDGICETMRYRVQRYDLKRLWWVATEVLAGLMDGHVANDIHLRRIMARLSLLIRNMSESGEDGIDERTSTSVTQSLLYHVSKSPPGCKGVDLVRERFQLDELAPDSDSMMRARGTLSGRDREMYRSMSAAVEDELAIVKDALDLELRTGQVDREQRQQSVEALTRLGETLGMLGLSGPGESLRRLIPHFEESAGSEREDRDRSLMNLAEQLLLVESALREQIDTLGDPVDEPQDADSFLSLSKYELRDIRCRVLDECVTSLQSSEEEVRKRLEGDRSGDPYEPLEQAAGALRLTEDDRAARGCLGLIDQARELLDNRRREQAPPPETVQALADAMAALELYLAARRDLQADADRFLETMEQRLEQLEEASQLPTEAPDQAEAVPPREPESMPPEAPRDETGIESAPDRPGEPQDEAPFPPPPSPESMREAGGEPPEPVPDPASEPAAAPAASAPDVGEDELPAAIDPELREIFLEEYEQVLEVLQEAIPEWMNHLEDVESLTEIRRAFHTLKGSGRMVGADELGDFAWEIENMLNALLEGRIQELGDSSMMVRLAQASLPALRQRMLQQEAGLTRPMILALGECAQTLSQGGGADWGRLSAVLPKYLANMLPEGQAPARGAGGEPETPGDEIENLRTELARDLEPVNELLEAVSRDRSTRVSEEQVRAVHHVADTLAARPEGRDAEIAKALGRLFEAQAGSGAEFTPDVLFTMIGAVGVLQNRLDRLAGTGEERDPDADAELLTQLQSLTPRFEGRSADRPESREPGPEAPAEPRERAEESASDGFDPGRSVFAGGAATDEELPPFTPSQPSTAGTGAEPAPPAMETTPEPASAGGGEEEAEEEIDQEILGIFLEEAQEVLERADTALNEWRADLQQLSWVQNLQREIHTFKGGARMAGLASIGEFSHRMETLLERIAGRALSPSLSAVQVLEEACDRLQGWVERVARGEAPRAGDAMALLQEQIEALEGVSVASAPPRAETEGTPDRETHAIPETEPEPETEMGTGPEPVPEVTPAPAPGADQAPPPAPAAPRKEPTGGGQIRVAAELLDKMVNAAGEVSIYRSRIEQQLAGMRSNLSEFDKTVDRLREQFRKLEIEIEVQIRSNYQDAPESADANFDPLELDQFSALQQLSRGMSESVSDLLNLQEMLEEGARSSEQLLVKQSRVSTELQEGLMKTRMVPFGTIAPRLRRIVRSAAQESGRRARLALNMVGSNDELDRNVLEHITVPLEHMMRNAVVHGIEEPSARRAAGKDEEGEITVTVESEATEFVIRIADDGAGIDTDKIRQRAIERGLLEADAKPSRQQLYEFMMNSGFSTTDKVTRLAGRGVGMDVVTSEIKQIGGSLEVDSERGKGSLFTIRIPFTLAIMQAIGAVAGDQRYLLPLSSVVGVSRIMPDEYRKLTDTEEPRFRFAGQEYPLLDLEPLLGERSTPLGRDNVSLLILAAGDHKAALRVPELLPHREVVIKPVGPQISSVPGILGGSITGDGSVLVILDPGPLIRHALIHGVTPVTEPEWALAKPSRTLVMIIDDSITMRKVTSRVLESHDCDVLTAKDGVDALEQLQERSPDIILCDIEMPRMDGYEVIERVREDARLRHIPIIMITSRAGQKHRDRAMQLGANAYLAKPYREQELTDEVFTLLARSEKD